MMVDLGDRSTRGGGFKQVPEDVHAWEEKYFQKGI